MAERKRRGAGNSAPAKRKSAGPTTVGNAASGGGAALCCDKCDKASPTIFDLCGTCAPLSCDKCGEAHSTESCPEYKRKRDDHPDAVQSPPPGAVEEAKNFPDIVATVLPKDKDGHCLFRALGGFRKGSNGTPQTLQLLTAIAEFQLSHPDARVFGTAALSFT